MKPILLVLLVCSTLSLQAQRNVHWIHGLGGRATSWQQFSQEFGGQRQILENTHNEYQSGNGVGGMVADIQTQIGATAGGTALGICHSMGGVAGRQLDVLNNGFFSGIITFGSPLRGARIANNVNGTAAQDYVANAVSQLRKGPNRQLFPIPQIITYSPVIQSILAILGIHDIDDFIGQRVVQGQRNELNLTPATATDIGEESAYNQVFYNAVTQTPKLVYWGNEASPIHVRMFAGTQPELLGHVISEQELVDGFNAVRQDYGNFRDVNYTLRWAFPALFPYYNWIGNGWADGYDYLAGQSENEWSNLIGAGYSYLQGYYSFEFVGTDYNAYQDCVNYANGDPQQIQNCENTYFQWVYHDYYVYVRDASDGLVPRRSQIGENTAWTNSNAEVRELPNNSHNEMRRSNESRDELNQAFDGNRRNGAFFIPQ